MAPRPRLILYVAETDRPGLALSSADRNSAGSVEAVTSKVGDTGTGRRVARIGALQDQGVTVTRPALG